MSQYIFVAQDQAITWSQAEAAAQAMGGHLVSVNTAAEDSFIRGVLAEHDDLWHVEPRDTARNGPWIGLTQTPGSPEPLGGWTWLDGTDVTFNGWHGGQPDNFINDRYGLYWDNDGTVGWADHIDDPVAGGYGAVTSYAAELQDNVRVLEATSFDDYVYGGDRDNVLRGRGGADELDGGGGADRLYGGAGRDRFVFATAAEADGDRILDLQGQDKIDLSAIDAKEGADGNQKFRLVDHFTGGQGQLMIVFANGESTISGDTDGDGVADFTIFANGDLRTFEGIMF